ncbi:MAG: PQQ-like beta-propeller repeat protein [Candidatus Wallbacteria bacterium]|nr:PQQ-like beta-propeller repeat protein [Candidatus Wallbacteria bacterium]
MKTRIALPVSPSLLWSARTKGLIWGTPVIDADGNVFVGSADKVLYALTPDGRMRWTYTLPAAGDSLIDSAATLTPNGLLVVPGGDGHLHALNRKTGELVWRFAAHHTDDHEGGVVVNSFEGNATMGPDGNLYAGSDNGYLYCLGLDGKEHWSFKTNMKIWSAPTFDPRGRWLTFGSLDRSVYVVERETGKGIASFKGVSRHPRPWSCSRRTDFPREPFRRASEPLAPSTANIRRPARSLALAGFPAGSFDERGREEVAFSPHLHDQRSDRG